MMIFYAKRYMKYMCICIAKVSTFLFGCILNKLTNIENNEN